MILVSGPMRARTAAVAPTAMNLPSLTANAWVGGAPSRAVNTLPLTTTRSAVWANAGVTKQSAIRSVVRLSNIISFVSSRTRAHASLDQRSAEHSPKVSPPRPAAAMRRYVGGVPLAASTSPAR